MRIGEGLERSLEFARVHGIPTQGGRNDGPLDQDTDESYLSAAQILSIRPLVAAETPQWSQDGARIVFVSSPGDTAELWSVPANGGFPTRLTVRAGDEGVAPRIPRWSPDGAVADRSASPISHSRTYGDVDYDPARPGVIVGIGEEEESEGYEVMVRRTYGRRRRVVDVGAHHGSGG